VDGNAHRGGFPGGDGPSPQAGARSLTSPHDVPNQTEAAYCKELTRLAFPSYDDDSLNHHL
jgi:hypothetical protein